MARSSRAAIRRAGLVAALRGGERAARARLGLGRQDRRRAEERRRRREAPACLRSAGRFLQLGGDVLVEARSRVREMPGAAVGVGLRVGRLGEGAVCPPAVVRR